jgi:hypothetical protein
MFRFLIFLFICGCTQSGSEKKELNKQKIPVPGFDHIPQIFVLKEENFFGEKTAENKKRAFDFPETETIAQNLGGRVEIKVLKTTDQVLPVLKEANARFFDMWLIFSPRAAEEFQKAQLPVQDRRVIFSFKWGEGEETRSKSDRYFKEMIFDVKELDRFVDYLGKGSGTGSFREKIYWGSLESREKTQNEIHGTSAVLASNDLNESLNQNMFPVNDPAAQGFFVAVGLDWTGWIRNRLNPPKIIALRHEGFLGGVGFKSGFLRAEISPSLFSKDKKLASQLLQALQAWAMQNL